MIDTNGFRLPPLESSEGNEGLDATLRPLESPPGHGVGNRGSKGRAGSKTRTSTSRSSSKEAVGISDLPASFSCSSPIGQTPFERLTTPRAENKESLRELAKDRAVLRRISKDLPFNLASLGTSTSLDSSAELQDSWGSSNSEKRGSIRRSATKETPRAPRKRSSLSQPLSKENSTRRGSKEQTRTERLVEQARTARGMGQVNLSPRESPRYAKMNSLFPETLGGLHLFHSPDKSGKAQNQGPHSPQGNQSVESPQGNQRPSLFQNMHTSPQWASSASAKPDPFARRPDVNPALIVDFVIDPNQPCHPGFTLGGLELDIVDHIFTGGEPPRVLSNAERGLDPEKLIPDGGSAVQAITYEIKEGWRVLACDGVKVGGENLQKALSHAWEENRECIIAFEVDAECVQKLQAMGFTPGHEPFHEVFARRKLLKELGLLCHKDKAKLLNNLNMQLRLVTTRAIMEAEVLLGTKPLWQMELAFSIQHVVQHDGMQFLEHLVNSQSYSNEIFLQRDSGGNVPLHKAQCIQALKFLLEREPRAQSMQNTCGQTPFQSYMTKRPQDTKELRKASDVISLLTEIRLHNESKVAEFLHLDGNGISLAMRLDVTDRASFLTKVAPWNLIDSALQSGTSEVLSALNKVTPVGSWAELLAFYCFGEHEVWHEGHHTAQSRTRLSVVWKAIEKALEQKPCSAATIDLVDKLLYASKGPCCPPLDPREPYREGLMNVAATMQAKSIKAMTLAAHDGDKPSSEAEDWAMGQADVPIFVEGLDQKELAFENLQLRWKAPDWFKSSHDMLLILRDLKRTGVIGMSQHQDSVYDMLRVAQPDQDSVFGTLSEDCKQDWMLGCWFGAWLRGSCQGRAAEVHAHVQNLFGSETVLGQNFFYQEAKTRIKCQQRVSLYKEIVEQVKRAGKQTKDARTRELFRKVIPFVNADVNSYRYVVDTFEDLRAAFVQLQSQQANKHIKVWRIENRFHRNASVTTFGYRDMRLWIELEGNLVVEIQLILRNAHEEEPRIEIPSRILRLQFDWSHVSEKRSSMVSQCYNMVRSSEQEGHREVAKRRSSIVTPLMPLGNFIQGPKEMDKNPSPKPEQSNSRRPLKLNSSGQKWLKAKGVAQSIHIVPPSLDDSTRTGYSIQIEKIFGNEERILRRMQKLPAYYQNSIFNVRFSADGSYLASGSASGEVRIYDLNSTTVKLLNNHSSHENDAITSVRWRPSRAMVPPLALASTSSKGLLAFYDAAENKILGHHFDEGHGIMTCDFTSNCSQICTGGSSGEVKAYDVEIMKPVTSCTSTEFHGIRGHSSRVLSLRCHPDNPDILITAGLDTRVITWDLRTARPERFFSGPQMVGDAMDISSDGTMILTGSCRTDDQLEVWDAGSSNRIYSLDWSTGEQDPFPKCLVYTAALSRDQKARFIVAGGKHDNLARVYCNDVAVGTVFGGTCSFWSSECSSSAGRIAFGMSDGRCLLLKCTRDQPGSPRSPRNPNTARARQRLAAN